MSSARAVYPRVCGAALDGGRLGGLDSGLSPRVRGSPRPEACPPRHLRSIPACAGQPRQLLTFPRITTVYPRVCGAAVSVRVLTATTRGLSPRVRGSLQLDCRRAQLVRSIPACAGQPRSGRPISCSISVYPRVCGAARRSGPRRRGQHRSIPACAGQPALCSMKIRRSTVYPRVCGAAIEDLTQQFAGYGLSPRVRGSLDSPVAGRHGFGSIPACAGQPDPTSDTYRRLKVYPRVCGAAGIVQTFRALAPGLSPRVRGSLPDRRYSILYPGSIPACAGQPSSHRRRPARTTVYPRVCGAADPRLGGYVFPCGLSPRVRGSLLPGS